MLKQEQEKKLKVLIVDDDQSTLKLLSSQLKSEGYEPIVVSSAIEGLEKLGEQSVAYDCVLLDQNMPEMTGVEMSQIMQKHKRYETLPFIMLTGQNSKDYYKDALGAGVLNYLQKPVDKATLITTIDAAIKQSFKQKKVLEVLKQNKAAFALLHKAEFKIQTHQQAQMIAGFITEAMPNKDQVLVGLTELFYNAIEHGLLGLDIVEKNDLQSKDTLHTYAEKQFKKAMYKDRFVSVIYEHSSKGYKIVIEDSGEGFDWKPYLSLDPAHQQTRSRRGIATANHYSFDRLLYNAKGNKVTAYIFNSTDIEW